MDLSFWLRTSGLSARAFAKRIGVSRQALHRYMSGRRTPRPEVMARIRAATGGEVTADDLLAAAPQLYPKPILAPEGTDENDNPGAENLSDEVAA